MKALKTVAIALGVTLRALIVLPLLILAVLFVWLKLTEESDEEALELDQDNASATHGRRRPRQDVAGSRPTTRPTRRPPIDRRASSRPPQRDRPGGDLHRRPDPRQQVIGGVVIVAGVLAGRRASPLRRARTTVAAA